jgi:hypothetical protein
VLDAGRVLVAGPVLEVGRALVVGRPGTVEPARTSVPTLVTIGATAGGTSAVTVLATVVTPGTTVVAAGTTGTVVVGDSDGAGVGGGNAEVGAPGVGSDPLTPVTGGWFTGTGLGANGGIINDATTPKSSVVRTPALRNIDVANRDLSTELLSEDCRHATLRAVAAHA